MKRALVAASVASMIDQFNMPNIRLLMELGYEVDVAANFTFSGSITKERAEELKARLTDMGVGVIDVPIPRKISAVGGIIRSYKMIKALSREKKYDLMHCHSPIGGAIARLAVRKERKKGYTKTVYTAHGFHFYKGAPKKNWLIYYPVEKICALCTDVLVTINHEDHALAERKLRAKRVVYSPGVGIDVDKFGQGDRAKKRAELGIPESVPLLLSVGELNANKNHEIALRALAESSRTDTHYAIVGKGDLYDELTALASELGITERVHLLGYRGDVAELYCAADLFVHPSYREGLPVSVIEAMASGLAVVASDIRGNADLIDECGGRLVCAGDVDSLVGAIDEVLSNDELRRGMGEYNRKRAREYSVDAVKELLEQIYN